MSAQTRPTPMATDAEDTGFLSRWSRRKVQVRQGAALDAAAAAAAVLPQQVETADGAAPDSTPLATSTADAPVQPLVPALTENQPPEKEALPTLADVAALTRDSDYSRFMARSVQPDVRNAALAKLFTDPHFNVMDGLDTYIDDYGKPDPLPPGMLRQMLQAHVLGLFDDEDDDTPQHPPPDATALQTETPTEPPTESPTEPPARSPADENTDLQLQPDDDAGRRGLAPGAGEDTWRAH